MAHVTSKDGTKIAYGISGAGPPLVVVWGALGYRGTKFAREMTEELAKSFTVYDYDRRGRGESGDTAPFEVAREVEDLRAVCEAAGGSPYVWATSSGAALALEAAAAGVPMRALAAHEPPYVGADIDPAYAANVAALVAKGDRDGAVSYFMRTVGVPGFFLWMMRRMSFWKELLPAAHTLPYDAAILGNFRVPEARLRRVAVPTIVLVGGSTTKGLRRAADEVARSVPGATLREIPKQNHGVKPKALRPALEAAFRAGSG